MRRVSCGDVCPCPELSPAEHKSADNEELLRRQLLSSERAPKQASAKPRPRQKNRWKLKFHHQALPPEYLDHYERSLKRSPPAPGKEREREREHQRERERERGVELWARRLAQLQRPASAPSRPLAFEDLPFMGEMTLDDAKPRRGRKPKKADICHLIYENYGTVVPGRPAPQPKTPAQTRLASSLLSRKRLREQQGARPAEPLNLCVRDPPNIPPPLPRGGSAPPASPAPPVPQPDWGGLLVHPLALQARLLYCAPPPAAAPAPPADEARKLVLKQISELLEPKAGERSLRERESAPAPPAKRKRSAIFVPAVPTRTSASLPAAEVSICKFKFTGGSKPSLQEKKMLSVDAGGNFRYYGGSGSKFCKGYDYLHGEASAERSAAQAAPAPAAPAPSPEGKRKRKSRKSLQRERLEQTFREKGFLIQTQQLQSAEGATYCKFRQLRKFTRYLFRSWKDYLPGELADKSETQTEASHAPATLAPPPQAQEWG